MRTTKTRDTLVSYCPICKEETTFRRADKGIALIGNYQCGMCKSVCSLTELNEAEGRDFSELIADKLSRGLE